MFENIGAVLAAAGAAFGDVVKVTVFLTDIDDRARSTRCGRSCSASASGGTLVEVCGLAIPGAKIEVEAVALLP